MKEGDLVKVWNKDGTTFGRGILLASNADLNRLMSDRYSSVWIFNFESGHKIEPRSFNIKTSLIAVIYSEHDW